VLDDGRITDSQGRTVDFRNTVIVMTSNIGSEHILEVSGDDSKYDEMEGLVLGALRSHFRPEFLNRIDESVVFHALGQEHIREIAGLQLSALKARLAERSLSLSISDEVMAYLADQGFDPVYGARPLKRAIQRLIENPLAESLLAGDFEPGDVIEVNRVGQDMRFSKAADVSQVA